MKEKAVVLMIMCFVLVLASCLSPYTEGEKNKSGLPGKETLIDYTSFEQMDGGIGYKFYTMDAKYRTPSGYTLWTYNKDPSDVFDRREVKLVKPTGDNIAGYGVIICSGQQVVEGRLEVVFMTVMINNMGQYAVGKVIGGTYIPIESWRTPGTLNSGSGRANIMVVEKDTEVANRYNLYFNGNHNVATDFFVDSMDPLCGGTGRNGYIVVISPNDISGSAVEVYFYE